MKREIFMPNGGYKMCDVLHHDDDFLIVRDDKDREWVCRRGYGTWCAMSPMDVVADLKRLRQLDRSPAA